MAIYRTDRERRILGDRIIARAESFRLIHSILPEVHGGFVQAHKNFMECLERRQEEHSQDAEARYNRDESASVAKRIYSWAYHKVESLVQPSWIDETSAEEVEMLRERLFPLGIPSTVANSTQLILDGLTHFLSALHREELIQYPEGFVQDASKAREALLRNIAKVTQEGDETLKISEAHLEARAEWDKHYKALREITGGFLRLQGKLHQLDPLFRPIPQASPSQPEPPQPDPADPVSP